MQPVWVSIVQLVINAVLLVVLVREAFRLRKRVKELEKGDKDK